jgi:hypothetical protein
LAAFTPGKARDFLPRTSSPGGDATNGIEKIFTKELVRLERHCRYDHG